MQRSNGTSEVFAAPGVVNTQPAERMPEAAPGEWNERLRFQEWFNYAYDGYLITDLQGIIEQANYVAATLLRTRREHLRGKPLGFFVAEESRSTFYRRLMSANERGIEQWEARLGRGGEPLGDVELTAAVLLGEGGCALKLRWTLRDVSVIRRTERALDAEKRLADGLADTVDNLILLVDADGRILRCNPFALALSGCVPYELRHRQWCEALLPDADRAAGRRLLDEAAQAGTAKSGVLGFLARAGGPRVVLWSARQLGDGFVLAGHDVTELHEAQRQALQAERLATIGQMAAALAHESRNALQRSQSCLTLLGLRLKDQPEAVDLLARVQRAQDDLQHLFEEVRGYAIDPRLERKTCDLRRIWREAWSDLSERSALLAAELIEDETETDTACFGDWFQLKQVFRNILENALSSGANPVRIHIHCRPALLTGESAVRVSVRDNGPGFPPENVGRLFDPFFTTKMRGTGLGLAICKRLIEAHGGRIEAGAGAEPGAEIVLTLPRSQR